MVLAMKYHLHHEVKTTVALFTQRCAIFSKALTFYIQREENNQSLKKEIGRKLRADN